MVKYTICPYTVGDIITSLYSMSVFIWWRFLYSESCYLPTSDWCFVQITQRWFISHYSKLARFSFSRSIIFKPKIKIVRIEFWRAFQSIVSSEIWITMGGILVLSFCTMGLTQIWSIDFSLIKETLTDTLTVVWLFNTMFP